jgi:hypothetical protein
VEVIVMTLLFAGPALAVGLAIALKRRSILKSRTLRVLVAGFAPSMLIVLVLSAWQVQARTEFDQTLHEPGDGFMGPLLFLIYGYPVFLAHLLMNLAVAGWAGRSK